MIVISLMLLTTGVDRYGVGVSYNAFVLRFYPPPDSHVTGFQNLIGAEYTSGYVVDLERARI